MLLVAPAVPAPLESAREFLLDVVGAESNVASHLVREGVSAGWAGAVGAGAPGRRLVATLAARGVDITNVAVDAEAPTGLLVKDPDPAGRRVYYYRRGSAASRLGPDFAARLPLATVPLVHLSGITPALSESCSALVDEIVDRRASVGLPVSLDVNFRPALWPASSAATRLLDLARRCDVVFVGLDEAGDLWGATTAAEVRSLLAAVPEVIVKDGGSEAHAYTSSGVAAAPPPAVDVVEPVGAGDAFAAGYLAARIGGSAPLARLERGHAAAGRVLTITTDY